MMRCLCTFLVLLVFEVLPGQCPVGDLIIETQADIDNFQSNYPGCTKIDGYLFVRGTDITDLSGLTVLDTVMNEFRINSTSLTEISGFANLKFVNELNINDNNGLDTISGFNALDSITALYVTENPVLRSISGFGQFESLDAAVIRNNPVIDELNVFTSLEYIYSLDLFNIDIEDLDFLSSVKYIFASEIFNLHSLIDLSGLNNLTNSSLRFRLLGCSSLQDLTTLSLNQADQLTFISNPNLISLNGLETVTSSLSRLIINNNQELVSLEGLNNISSIGQLTIYQNENLSDCSITPICNKLSNGEYALISLNAGNCETDMHIVLDCDVSLPCPNSPFFSIDHQIEVDSFAQIYQGCTTIHGNIQLSNFQITDASGLSVIDTIFGNLTINSTEIETLSGLDNLKYVEDIEIYLNSNLDSIKGFNGLDTFNNFSVFYNDELRSIEGFANAKLLNGSLAFFDCSNLDNIDAFPSLQAAYGLQLKDVEVEDLDFLSSIDSINTMWFEDLYDLTSISGISNVQSSQTNLLIDNCDLLTDFSGLAFSSLNDLTIKDNDKLVSLNGLESISGQINNLIIEDNKDLISIDGLQNVQTFNSLITIKDNDSLSDCAISSICNHLAGNNEIVLGNNNGNCNTSEEIILDCGISLPCPTGDFTLDNQLRLDSFSVIYLGCNKIPGNLIITGNNIESIIGLSSIDTILGDLMINETNAEIMDAFDNLQFVNNINIVENNFLDSLFGFTSIDTISTLEIAGNFRLDKIDAYTSLNQVDNLDINGSLFLDKIQGFSSFERINNKLELEGLDLEDLNFLDQLNTVSEISLKSLSDLTDISGLSGLSDSVLILKLEMCGALHNISALQLRNLNSLLVEECHSLTSLDGLNFLTSPISNVSLVNNNDLSSIQALSSIPSFTDISIYNNPKLSNCSIYSICQHLSNGGNSNIYNNKVNCNSSTEIISQCILNPLNCPDYISLHQTLDFTGAYEADKGIFFEGTALGNTDAIFKAPTVYFEPSGEIQLGAQVETLSETCNN